jgi:signal transduction histidine kinase
VTSSWQRPLPGPAALRSDALVAAVGALLGVASLELYRSAGMAAGDATGLEQSLWVVAMTVPLAARRRYPLTVMLVCAAVFFATGLRSPGVVMGWAHQIGLFAAIYSAGAWAPDRRRLGWLRAAVLVGMLSWVVQQLVTTGGLPTAGRGHLDPQVSAALVVLGVNLLYFGGAWWVGDLAWRTARQRDQLAQQARQLEVQADEMARRAVLDERVRIARELHDVVAHHVSVIGVQAAGARRVLGVDAAAATTALEAVEESSREAVSEMRQLLGVLRAGGEDDDGGPHDRSPQRGLGDLDDLVRTAAEQGLSVELRRVGQERAVPPTVQLSLYRTAQEALANVRRHSTATAARLVLRYVDASVDRPPAVEVEVLDDGSPAGSAPGSGLGHTGMRERAALHGGSVEIGRRPFGGFRVRARYPLADRADRADRAARAPARAR